MQRLSGIRNASPMFMRQLVYLVALDRHRHFARAAEACHVSQPALSAGLAELERELGITIIKRNRSFQGITPEGERVLAWAHQVLASLDGLKQEAALVRQVAGGHVSIGTIPRRWRRSVLWLAPFGTAFRP
jgi:DNA-binding transcriptional LysR family regulator